MRRVKSSFLKPGMVIARGIYTSQGQVLLRDGTLLTNRYIARLQHLGVQYAYIKDDKLTLPVTIEVITDETRINAMVRTRDILENANTAGISIKHEDALKPVSDIISELLANRDTVVNLTDIRLDDDYLFAHSVNTCVLAILTGISMGFNRDKLHDLGIGALLHDAGKMLIPKVILNKPGSLSDWEMSVIRQHPEHGFRLLKDVPVAREIAYKHHERYDGSGYPRGLSGASLDELSQITAMADVFDALTTSRQYRDGYPPHEAYEYLAASGNKQFEMRILQSFLNNIAAYPIGELVELSNGSLAVVLETPYGAPLRPKVKLINEDDIIQLSYSDLHIVRVLPYQRVF